MLLGLLLALGGCHKPPAGGADVAVRIDGEEIHYGEFELYLRDYLSGGDPSLDSAVQSGLFDQFLDAQLLIRLAIERGLVETEVDMRQAIELLLSDYPRQAPTSAQIQAYYEAHKSKYQRPEEVHLKQILVPERALAEEAQQAIADGEDFAQVAARISQEPRAHLGGDQGRLAREDLPASFVDAIFALAPGEVTDIISADYGFHLFQVVAVYPAEIVSLEQVSAEIAATLERLHLDELVNGFILEARDRYNIAVFPTNFPFDYQGYYAQQHQPSRTD
ncbi:MAG: peptidylprolyl isomerase [Acidobacteriota bacterium]